MNWLQKINQTLPIQINMSEYNQHVAEYITDLADRSSSRIEQLRNFQVDAEFIVNTMRQVDYPDVDGLAQALRQADHQQIEQYLMQISEWNVANRNPTTYDVRFRAYRMLRDYADHLSPVEYSNDEVQRDIARTQANALQNMNWISEQLQQAIGRIGQWRGSSLFITPNPSSDVMGTNWLTPAEDAIVHVGTGDMAPDFEIFIHDGKIEIPPEGIVEDDDFFQDPNSTSDYFNLIRELQKPGSTSRPGKVLTLYTARPSQDRERYENATTVPGGIWLSSSPSNAELEGVEAGGQRDIWMVQIEDKYVQKKLDTPAYKHYEVVGRENVPVRRIRLY